VPETTTFSDCVVVSYPAFDDREQIFEALGTFDTFKSVWTGVVLKDSIRILHAVAERALRIGLLIRGGLALGQFYHRDGVVFGEALVEAYALESKIANTPRILVSNHIVTLAMGDPSGAITTLLKDIDAKWHVNYYTEMVRERIHPGPGATCNSIPACFCK